MKGIFCLNHKDFLAFDLHLPVLLFIYLALESNMGRLDKLDFEDVFNRDSKNMKMNAHDVYLSQCE